jgi:hypothetical protein
VGYAGTWLRDVQRLDFVGNSVQKRFLLPGVDARLCDAARQETPTGLATALALVAPTAAPSVTVLGSGGSIAPGRYYLAVAYTETVVGATAYTAPSAYTTVDVSTSSSRLSLTWSAPSTGTSPTAGSEIYLSPSIGNPDIVQSTSTSGATASATISTLPAASNARPLKDYTALFTTYTPFPNLEQDIGVDGTASVGNATLQVTTAPTLGDRFRVVYDRKPAIPTQDADTIYVEQGEIRVIALMFAAAKCIALAEGGDTTLLNSIYATAQATVMDMQRKATPVLPMRPRLPDPRSSLTDR